MDAEDSKLNFCVDIEDGRHSCCSRRQLEAPLIKCGLCKFVLGKAIDAGCDSLSAVCLDLEPVCAFGTMIMPGCTWRCHRLRHTCIVF